MVRTRRLLVVLLTMAAVVSPVLRVSAQDSLQLLPGEFKLECEAGYRSYAFPIADAALARRWTAFRFDSDEANWARRGDMAYQLAFDYSVVPVYFRIEHRQPYAFAGSIELETAHGYGPSEDPIGHRTLLRHDFVAPPSVPLEFTLAPRVVPVSRPGRSERLVVRVFQKGVKLPIHRRELTVTQLEPAHLYSLVLDNDAIPTRQEINPNNRLKLLIPARNSDGLDPSIYSTSHWYIGVPRRAVTGMPLAARQFAFVFADLDLVKNWPAAEQAGLVQYLLGGGRLMLYHAPHGKWQAISLAKPQPVGRGWLIPVAGDLAAAKAKAASWLEGELEEFTLYAKGSVNGVSLNEDFFNAFNDTNLQLDEVYASPPPGTSPAPLSHRAGYLHPVWMYRNAVDCGAVEPWDYPEFTQFKQEEASSNILLQSILGAQPSAQLPASLSQLLTSHRQIPTWWAPLLAVVALIALGLALPLRAKYRLGHIGSVLLAAVGIVLLWINASPIPHPKGQIELKDSDQKIPQSLSRSVYAQFCDRGGDCSFRIPPAALVRRVDWQPAGNWVLHGISTAEGLGELHWLAHGGGAGPYVAIRADSVAAARPLGLVATVETAPNGYLVTIDASLLPKDQLVLVHSILGWTPLKASSTPLSLYLNVPAFPAQPGMARAQALQELAESWGRQTRTLKSATNFQSRLLLAQLLDGGWTPDLKRGAPLAEVQRLGWSAILQDPLGGRGLPLHQLVIYTIVPGESANPSTDQVVGLIWSRYCMPLP